VYYPSLIYLENLFTDTRKILDATEFARNDIATPIIPKMGPKIKIKDTCVINAIAELPKTILLLSKARNFEV